MTIPTGFRQSMTWMHTCLGLGFGWLLYVVFLTGSLAVFSDEITVWMTPEFTARGDRHRAIALAESRLKQVAPDADSWAITPPSPRQRFIRIEWASQNDGANAPTRGTELLDLATGQPVAPRETQGGLFFHRLHYRFQTYGCCRGFWFSGAAAIALMASVISGLIIHRRIVAEFFTLRLRAGASVAWLDLHKRFGVLALPFHLMIAFTGLMPMVSVLMFAPVIAHYRGDQDVLEAYANYDPILSAFLRERRVQTRALSPSAGTAALVPLETVLKETSARWNGELPGRLAVTRMNEGRALIEATASTNAQVSTAAESLFFDGGNGQLIQSFGEKRPVLQVFSILYGLHVARFADTVVRWMYFVLGLASTALIGTGLVVWTVKRRGTATSNRWHRVVESINVAVIMGLPIAIAGFFWVNRLFPVEMLDRSTREVHAFFAVWIVVSLALAASRPMRAWVWGLSLAAVAFAGLPVLDTLTTGQSLLSAFARHDWVLMSFDLTMVAVSALFAWAAWKVARLPSRTDNGGNGIG